MPTTRRLAMLMATASEEFGTSSSNEAVAIEAGPLPTFVRWKSLSRRSLIGSSRLKPMRPHDNAAVRVQGCVRFRDYWPGPGGLDSERGPAGRLCSFHPGQRHERRGQFSQMQEPDSVR